MAEDYRDRAGAVPADAAQATSRSRGAEDDAEERDGRQKARRSRRRRDKSVEHSALGERLIAGVPARIMRPRIIFVVSLAAILAFGLLMVYSASSVTAQSDGLSPTYYLVNQAKFVAAGLVLAIVVSHIPLTWLRSDAMWAISAICLALLLGVLLFGEEHGGATRWITIAGQQFQPSEFVKPVIIVTAAMILHNYYEEKTLSTPQFILTLGISVALPLLLIILEPDLGTCLIIAGTVFVMCYLAGFSYKVIIPTIALGAAVVLILVFSSGYRASRVGADPWEDMYGSGYQATVAIMAFASGGLFGRGIGNSTMKYNYLPEAHTDYILAIIGEEVGFVGTLIFFAVYALMVYAIFKIATQSPTVQGRLIAYGCGVLIMLQFLINALGILGVTPMTGKTMPFISYGGSSMLSMLGVVGLVMRVSVESEQRTVHDERRARMVVVGEEGRAGRGVPMGDRWGAEDAPAGGYAVDPAETTAGSVHVRSGQRRGFTVLDGTGGTGGTGGSRGPDRTGDGARRSQPAGADATPAPGRAARRGASVPLSGTRGRGNGRSGADASRDSGDAWLAGRTAPSGGYERINLDYDPAERLRVSDEPADTASGERSARGRSRRGGSRDGR